MSEAEEAIAWMEEARESHRLWAEFIEERGVEEMRREMNIDAAGQREWERRYDVVLGLLREIP